MAAMTTILHSSYLRNPCILGKDVQRISSALNQIPLLFNDDRQETQVRAERKRERGQMSASRLHGRHGEAVLRKRKPLSVKILFTSERPHRGQALSRSFRLAARPVSTDAKSAVDLSRKLAANSRKRCTSAKFVANPTEMRTAPISRS